MKSPRQKDNTNQHIKLAESLFEMLSKALPPLFKYGGFVLITYFAKDIVVHIGGKTTAINASFWYPTANTSKLGFPTFYCLLAILFLIIVIIVQFIYIRKINKTNMESEKALAKRVQKLEGIIDHKRSSAKKQLDSEE